ncbi:hypothetical protein M3O96_16000 [Aquiflexum sp. TKW24L]|uniref:hypothetical protein n=1 Tax=Aquiflexum sp. TKW24L TaxID=2942212 RepID=UPI0020BDA064|nr:hypothetical protein [Aquiflexum sp. TKW24L]MCL6260607.1 hypothetical protein [Aquiflexum sp. TKW24L]
MEDLNILKNELKEMLEEISDLKVLQSIKELLESKSIEEAIRIQLIENAEKAEADIKAGRVFDNPKKKIISEEEFIGISSDGSAISGDSLRKELFEASKRVKSGIFFNQEEVENESESW